MDLLTVAGHKMYAPKGIAALYVRPGLRLEPVVYGGGQERGLRAGTENVAFAVALGAGSDLARADLRDRLHAGLAEVLPGHVVPNGHPRRRLPNTLNISITGVRGEELLAATPDVAAATGSARSPRRPQYSPRCGPTSGERVRRRA